ELAMAPGRVTDRPALARGHERHGRWPLAACADHGAEECGCHVVLARVATDGVYAGAHPRLGRARRLVDSFYLQLGLDDAALLDEPRAVDPVDVRSQLEQAVLLGRREEPAVPFEPYAAAVHTHARKKRG